jgi:DNA-directed RNA polymerase beta' subunit
MSSYFRQKEKETKPLICNATGIMIKGFVCFCSSSVEKCFENVGNYAHAFTKSLPN